MMFFKIRTREQQYLAIPLISGTIAGLAGLVYLFSIPADLKNALLWGFSLFRILEAAAILIVSLAFLGLLIHVARNPDLALRLCELLDWHNPSPWSLSVAWVGLLAGLCILGFGGQVFPGQAPYIERLSPLLVCMAVFLAAFISAQMLWHGRNTLRNTVYHLIRIGLITLTVGLVGGLVIFPANIGLMLHQGSLLILLLCASVLYYAFEKTGIQGKTAGFLLIGMLFGGALVGVWASGITDFNIIGGLLPFNDANGYFQGGRLLAEGRLFHPFSAKRPLFPALLGVLYWLSGRNLQIALGCLTLILILVVYFCAHEVKKTAGSAAAVFLVIGLFLFIRRFIGSTMSETLGLPLGLLGFTFLWMAAIRRRLRDAAAGMLLLSLGLLARAGPFFILPLMIIWGGLTFRKTGRFNWKAAGILTAAAGLGFLIHFAVYYGLSEKNSSSMANFSYTLYGLVAGGKGWKQYLLDHPDVLNLVEPYQSQAIYAYAWAAFKENPLGIFKGAMNYWQAFFTMEWSGLFGYVEGINPLESLVGRWGMAIFSLAGLAFSVKQIRKPEYSMILAGIIGILLSVPFAPTIDAEIRTYAAGIPWMIALGMLGILGLSSLLGIQTPKAIPTSAKEIPYSVWSAAAGLILLTCIVPFVLHAVAKPGKLPETNLCTPDAERIVTSVSRGSYLNVLPDAASRQSFVPDLRDTDFRQSLHDAPMYATAQKLLVVKPGYSFFYGYNLENRMMEDIVAKTELFEDNPGWVELCGWRETQTSGNSLFHAESARVLTP